MIQKKIRDYDYNIKKIHVSFRFVRQTEIIPLRALFMRCMSGL